MQKVIKVTNDTIIIDKKKVLNTIALISMMALTIVKYLLCIAAVIFFFVCICAGGDGRVYDGDPKLALTTAVIAMICCIGSGIINLAYSMIVHSARKMNCRKHS